MNNTNSTGPFFTNQHYLFNSESSTTKVLSEAEAQAKLNLRMMWILSKTELSEKEILKELEEVHLTKQKIGSSIVSQIRERYTSPAVEEILNKLA